MLPRTLWILAAALLLLLPGSEEPAGAAYPCPGGPGANEVQVGETGGGGGVAGVPVCAPRQPGNSAPSVPDHSYVYGSIAWHPDVADVWMSGNWLGPNAAAREALAECQQAMGGGCSSIGEWHNSSMSIIRDRSGALWSAWNGQGGTARKQLLKDCTAKQVLPCEVVGSFGAGKRRHRPDLATARKKYSVAAWVVGAEGFDNRLYIAGGYDNWPAAEKAVLDACAKATGRKCGVPAFASNGFIQTYEMLGKGYSVTAETSAKRAQQAAKLLCKAHKPGCKMQILYDSRTPGIQVHDFPTGRAL